MSRQILFFFFPSLLSERKLYIFLQKNQSARPEFLDQFLQALLMLIAKLAKDHLNSTAAAYPMIPNLAMKDLNAKVSRESRCHPFFYFNFFAYLLFFTIYRNHKKK